MHGLFHPLKRSCRIAVARPWFRRMVVVVLLLGIAATAVVFGISHSLFPRPLPFAASDRLVDLDETAPEWNLEHVGVSNSDLYQWRTQNSTFETMAFFRTPVYNLSTGKASERIEGAQVTREMLEVLRLKPFLGRNFTASEDRPGGAGVVLLSYGLWHRRFGGNPHVLGGRVKLDGEPYTVVGVLPREAVLPDRAELWVPLAADPNVNTGYYVNGIGRLKAGVSLPQAQADLVRIHKAMIAQGHATNRITSPILTPLRESYVSDFRTAGRLLLSSLAMAVLVAGVNVRGAMVHTAGRSRELAIRTVPCASRGGIARPLFSAALVPTSLGGTLGFLIGAVGLGAVRPQLAENLARWIRFSLDWRFAFVSMAITCAATLVFRRLPALENLRGDVSRSLRTPVRHRRTKLVLCEIGLALMLAISASLVVQAFRNHRRVEPGYQPQNALTFARIPDRACHTPAVDPPATVRYE